MGQTVIKICSRCRNRLVMNAEPLKLTSLDGCLHYHVALGSEKSPLSHSFSSFHLSLFSCHDPVSGGANQISVQTYLRRRPENNNE